VFSLSAGSSAERAQPSVKLPEGVARSAVTLQEAADAVKATFTAANQAGISSARISLTPESLGGIKISLTQTPDGLIARVTADHADAAQTLQQNAGDLKRSLEQSGMSLLRLDIGSSGQQSLGGSGGSRGDGSSTGNSWSSDQADKTEEDTSNPSELTVELPSGSLVNVLA
jgi:flagellar hook-length control protein FliK